MGRPPTPVGTYGKVSVRRDGDGYRARAHFRDFDGQLREVSRWASTAAAAERSLKEAMTDRANAGRSGEVRPESKFEPVAELWLEDVDTGALSTNTRELYRLAAKSYLIPSLGGLRLREIDVVAVNRVLAVVERKHGVGAAKTARSVLSSILGSAVQVGALPTNPVRDAKRISQPRKPRPRALTRDEADNLVDKLRSDERAIAFDVPDLADWMLGTGMRIGETLCVRRAVLVGPTVEVNATMVRIKGQGLRIQQWPKTDPGWRRLSLPEHLVLMLERKATEERVKGPDGVVFASPRGKLMDRSNISDELRGALDRAGFEWVHSHTFRKTVATWMDEAGMPARVIADQLGHARPSMTQDVYMGRQVVSADAARVLSR